MRKNSIEQYRRRKAIRMRNRADTSEPEWITVNGTHIPIEGGKAVGGPVEGQSFANAESTANGKKAKRKQKENGRGRVTKAEADEFIDTPHG